MSTWKLSLWKNKQTKNWYYQVSKLIFSLQILNILLIFTIRFRDFQKLQNKPEVLKQETHFIINIIIYKDDVLGLWFEFDNDF